MSYPRILILSSNFGAGHFKAGEALLEEFNSQLAGRCEVVHLDFGSFFYKKTDYLMRTAYLKMIRKTPELWGKIFKHTVDIPVESKYRKFVKGIGHKNLTNYIREFNPDVIICTHFLPSGIVAEFKRKGFIDVPIVTVVTDYIIHGIWIHSGIDLYIVGCEEVYDRLRKRGIKPEKISLSGIPVRSRFEIPLEKKEARQKLGLDPHRQTIMVMGGGCGLMSKAKEIKQALLDVVALIPAQVMVVCGNDRELYNSFAQLAGESPIFVKCCGFVDNVDELMAAADILITKGGALTISEALTRGLPLIMFKPIPGHENGNAKFVEKSGGGLAVNTSEELSDVLKFLLWHPEKLKKMSTAAKALLPQHSAKNGVNSILSMIEKKEEILGKHSWKTG